MNPCPSVQFSPLTDWVVWGWMWGGSGGGHEEWFSRDLLPVDCARGPCEQFWYGQGCPLFDVAHPALHLPTTASPILQDALKYGFGEAAVACGMPEPCTFPSPDSCQELPEDPQGRWSCSTPSCWSCAPSRECREVSSGTRTLPLSKPFLPNF